MNHNNENNIMSLQKNGLLLTRSGLDDMFADISQTKPIDQLMVSSHGVLYEWEIGVMMNENTESAAVVCYIRQTTDGVYQIFAIDRSGDISLLTRVYSSPNDTVIHTHFKTMEQYYRKAFEQFIPQPNTKANIRFTSLSGLKLRRSDIEPANLKDKLEVEVYP